MTTDKFQDYYTILEVLPDADDLAIRSSYRRLAKLRHPDRNPDNAEATIQFQLLQHAYSILVDPQTRQKFDRRRQQEIKVKAQFVPVNAPAPPPRPAPVPRPAPQPTPMHSAGPWPEKTKPNENNSRPAREGQPRREKGDAYRWAKEDQLKRAQDEAVRLQREAAAQRLRESGQRIREAAMRVREAAYRIKDERDRREREQAARQAAYLADRKALEEAELKVMELD
ncbi:DnaJ domain-containing protein [Thelonectria olida]|uniref:DnaJ domain-containing protein n=1 Tax=Thelonectria olida TaxID=1576542 RepID=A0A9P8VUM8_9HYPO|nr:DnaJ domain-containing protein [Thelonectria olida]